jgi:4-hydroxy-3-polyprenylbenzoate decarboxylase
MCANTDPQRDSTFVKSPCDALDHAPTIPCIGSHMGIDATRKLPTEGYTRSWPELVKMDLAVRAKVEAMRQVSRRS